MPCRFECRELMKTLVSCYSGPIHRKRTLDLAEGSFRVCFSFLVRKKFLHCEWKHLYSHLFIQIACDSIASDRPMPYGKMCEKLMMYSGTKHMLIHFCMEGPKPDDHLEYQSPRPHSWTEFLLCFNQTSTQTNLRAKPENGGIQKMEIQFFRKKIIGCQLVLAKSYWLYRWL